MTADGQRQGRRQDGGDPERAEEDGEDLDAEGGEPEHPGDALPPGQHHHRVVAALGHHRDDGHPGAQGQADEAGPATEVDPVPVGPGSARLPVTTREVEHQGAVPRGRSPPRGSSRDGPDPPEEGADHRDGEQEVVGEGVRRVLGPPAIDDGQGGDPGVGHVEERVVVPDQEGRTLGRQVADAPDLRGEDSGCMPGRPPASLRCRPGRGGGRRHGARARAGAPAGPRPRGRPVGSPRRSPASRRCRSLWHVPRPSHRSRATGPCPPGPMVPTRGGPPPRM